MKRSLDIGSVICHIRLSSVNDDLSWFPKKCELLMYLLHNLSGHLLFKSICFVHLRVKISVISAHLTAPQSIRVSSSALPFHFPFTVGSLSPVTCAQAVGRLVCSQPVTIAATGFTVVSPSSSLPALQVLGSSAFQSHLAGTGERGDWRFLRVGIDPFCRICCCYYPHLFLA